jgi:hypothetical protein
MSKVCERKQAWSNFLRILLAMYSFIIPTKCTIYSEFSVTGKAQNEQLYSPGISKTEKATLSPHPQKMGGGGEKSWQLAYGSKLNCRPS